MVSCVFNLKYLSQKCYENVRFSRFQICCWFWILTNICVSIRAKQNTTNLSPPLYIVLPLGFPKSRARQNWQKLWKIKTMRIKKLTDGQLCLWSRLNIRIWWYKLKSLKVMKVVVKVVMKMDVSINFQISNSLNPKEINIHGFKPKFKGWFLHHINSEAS